MHRNRGGGNGGGHFQNHYDDHRQHGHPQAGRVKVEDALSYLDQVKTQFAHDPEVYAQFLDIMKDFKSQAITTPGVIARVSRLFTGRPALIMGFNTFLPDGFEVKVEGTLVTVREPDGSCKIVSGHLPEVENGNQAGASYPHYLVEDQVQYENDSNGILDAKEEEIEEGSYRANEDYMEEEISQEDYYMPDEDGQQNDYLEGDEEIQDEAVYEEEEEEEYEMEEEEPARAQSLPAPPTHQDPQFGLPAHLTGQLHIAIGYVNKIKSRYSDRPVLYKQFLDILSEFQRSLNDPEFEGNINSEQDVVTALTALFRDDDDLIRDLQHFLPEGREREMRRQQLLKQRQAEQTPEMKEEPEEEGSLTGEQSDEEDLPDEKFTVKPVIDIATIDPKVFAQQLANQGVSMEDITSQSILERFSFIDSLENTKKEEEEEEEEEPESEEEEIIEDEEESERYEYPVPKKMIDYNSIDEHLSAELIGYMHKVRTTVRPNEHQMFLRVINLYTAHILNKEEVLGMLRSVIGGYTSLLNEFRKIFMNTSNDMDDDTSGEDLPTTSFSLTLEEKHEVDYTSCKQLGISYRSLPANHKPQICSGRTPLCKSVLNDTWVSFPSWSSEDSSCVASKKTQYEDFVYRTEDERFELDIVIEINKYALETLEGVRRRLSSMTMFEQEKLRLDDKLGGSSASLMTRAIRRIYGEHSTKVLEGLQRNPSATLSKVITRLIEKDQEWHEAQSAMNRVWREQNEKHMIRALDHQSAHLKTNDAKQIKAKYLYSQIEAQFDDRQQRAEEGRAVDEGPHQVLIYSQDNSVVYDVNDLIVHFTKRQSNINKDEKKKIKKVLRRLLTEWLFLEKEPMSDDETDENTPPKKPKTSPETETKPVLGLNRYRMIYGGNSLFVFFKLHHMLCERLGKVKQSYYKQVKEYEFEQETTRMQEELYERLGKSIDVHESNASDACNGLADIRGVKRCPIPFYNSLINEVKGFLDGQTEVTNFEDNVRVMFPVDGYLLFTVDKLISVITRQLHQLVSDGDNTGTIKMYSKYRQEKPFITTERSDQRAGIEGEYAAEAENRMNCLNCFKLYVFDGDHQHITIELIDTETGELPDMERAQKQARKLEEAAQSAAASSEDEDENDMEDNDDSSEHTQASSITGRRLRLAGGLGRMYNRKSRRKIILRRAMPFLMRNTRFLSTPTEKSKLHEDLLPFDSCCVVRPEGVKMAAGSSEGFLKRTRQNRQVVLENLERMNSIRRYNAGDYWPSERNSTWLDNGTTKLTVHHPKYPFLIYNKYSCTKDI